MPYGYSGVTPNQKVKNKVVFSVNDINALVESGNWGGSLELLQEQSITSSTASMIFSTMKESTYDVHLLTYVNSIPVTAGGRIKMQLYESGVLETASVYQWAMQSNRSDGTYNETKSTAADNFHLGTNTESGVTGSVDNAFIYIYDAGNSDRYTFINFQTSGLYEATSSLLSYFGGGVLPQKSTVDGIKLFSSAGNIQNLQAKLYGVKKV